MSANTMLTGDINTTLKSMTLPVVFGMVMMMSFGLVDTFFVSLLGTEALAAISFTFPVTFTVISLNIGLGIGTSAVIGKLRGAGANEEAKLYASGALILAVAMVSVLALVGWWGIDVIFGQLNASPSLMPFIHDYMGLWYLSSLFLALPMAGNAVLRASGDTRTPSIIMALGGLLNAVLDPLFIFGFGPIPAMGIKGAALATLLAWMIGAALILYILTVKRQLLLPRWLSWQELISSSRTVLVIGLPAAGANMLTPIAGGVITAVVAGFGDTAVAAWGVGNRLESIACIVVLALSMSLPPFISQNIGARQLARVEQAYRASLAFVVLWQLLIFVIMWLSSPLLATIFAQDPEVALLIQTLLAILPLGYGLQGVVILTNSSLNAMHHPMAALALSILRLFVFYVPFTYAASLWFGLTGLFWGAVFANATMALISYFWFLRTLRQFESTATRTS